MKTIADYTGNPETAESDVATEYTYDGDGNVLMVTADEPSGAYQRTAYVYGVTTASGCGAAQALTTKRGRALPFSVFLFRLIAAFRDQSVETISPFFWFLTTSVTAAKNQSRPLLPPMRVLGPLPVGCDTVESASSAAVCVPAPSV